MQGLNAIYSSRYSVRKKIVELIEGRPDLPPLPEVLLGLQKLMNDPDCEVEDVYRLLKTDPVLSGRIITLVVPEKPNFQRKMVKKVRVFIQQSVENGF
jgi:hypothetical protein